MFHQFIRETTCPPTKGPATLHLALLAWLAMALPTSANPIPKPAIANLESMLSEEEEERYVTPRGQPGESLADPGETNLEETLGAEETPGESVEIEETDYDGIPTNDQFYKIKPGDTLGKISKKFYGTIDCWKELARVNKISKPEQLKVGTTIRIPARNDINCGPKKKVKITRQAKPPAPTPKAPESIVAIEPKLPPVTLKPPAGPKEGKGETLLYEDLLPKEILPGGKKKGEDNEERRATTLSGITGLTRVMAGYPLGDGKLNTGFHISYEKVTKNRGRELKPGEDGTLTEFPLSFTYSTSQFETALMIPFKSYDIFAPVTFAYQSGTDSGLGDIELAAKFSNKTDLLASALGIGVVFPTDDTIIGGRSSTSAWQIFGALSTLRGYGGNVHLNAGYRTSSNNSDRDHFFAGLGFDYTANDHFTFMGELFNENEFSGGQSTDLILGMRYLVREGLNLDLSTPIALTNDKYVGYDYKVVGGFQYKY